MIDWRDIPLFVINRNRLSRGFDNMVEWFLWNGTRHVIVIDNQSTYPPLLDYYRQMKEHITVQVQDSNLGPRGFWTKKQYHLDLLTPYMVTDCDLFPSLCPADLVPVMLDVLMETRTKVGPSLAIDDLPDHYSKKELVVRWESQFWTKRSLRSSIPAWEADIDTTLAMYLPQQGFTRQALRLDVPYTFAHAPWYVDESLPNEEDAYYREHYETEHCGGQAWKTDEGTVELYGWATRSKASLEATFRRRGLM